MIDCKEVRTREGLHWEMECNHTLTRGFTPDEAKISTKPLSEAQTREEFVFIGIRELFEQNESICLDDETDRLTLCHKVSGWVRRNLQKIQESE